MSDDWFRKVEEDNRRRDAQQRHDRERRQDKADEERRHRERLRAAAPPHDRASASEDGGPTRSGGGIKLLAILAMLLLVGYGAMTMFSDVRPVDALDAPDLGDQADSEADEVRPEPDEESVADAAEEETSPADTAEIEPVEENSPAEELPAPVIDQLQTATLNALNTGSRISWRDGAENGYVAVSGPVTVSAGVCRNVSYDSGDGAPVGAPQTWCKGADGAWRRR